MSFLTTPFVADTVARFMGSFSPRPASGPLGFPEIRGNTQEVQVPTRHGELTCTLYAPTAEPESLPGVYVNFHGGGFVVPGRRQDDPWCRYLAAATGSYILNVEYSTAPHVRFPVPVEQAYEVTLWAASVDRPWNHRRVAVGGQSAGGNLAAGAARMALDAHSSHISLQVLHYAPLDLVTDIRLKPSPLAKTVLRGWMRDVFETAYTPDPELRKHPLASPVWGSNADDLTGIAPAIVATCEYDRLRNEGVTYAQKLAKAGALISHVDIPKADHGYNLLTTRELAETGYSLLAPLIAAVL
ncbi:hypothetical protein ASF40_20510 [Microbacterium sp. Leaf288]|uniref:alpha/beta hydrolase fold domain-containing protein n=1 Tax=Microbacterium sp. Leaf288 TaxID=1736323 RepID=UPI0006FB0078|nr:alpha/beta hydrolase fold domain-containing protein [Microbacterium sp. Leaf288]KQP73226.1 hypothetical protein ASF40_20510 [Microbacterium sp. Leaf288]